MQLYEVLINELYFQGVSVLNEIRKVFFIDSLDPNLTVLETKYFNAVTFIYCTDDEKHKDSNQADDNNRQELHRILQNFCMRKKRYEAISLREFMVKIFLTIVRNSNEPINYSILDNIIKKFMTPKKQEFNNEMNNNEEVADDAKEKLDDTTGNEKKKSQIEDSTRPCIETLLKIIDVGLDKSYDDFIQDINMISGPIVKITENFNMMANIELKNTPITEYRCYLKPQYFEKKKISILDDRDDKISLMNKSDYLNIYEYYKTLVQDTYTIYFSHFDDQSGMDSDMLQLQQKKRNNFYKDYRIKFVLIEDQKVFSSFIDYLFIFYNDLIHKEKFEEDFNTIWSKFVKNKEEFEINFVLYILPQYNNYKEIYATNHLAKNEKSEDVHPLLSEFIANNDDIYKNTVYLPWAVPRENELSEYMTKMNENIGNGGGDFQGPTQNMLYSYLHQPLNLYISDADHILNLNLYKLTIEQGNHRSERLFWKSVDIILNTPKKTFDLKLKKENNVNSTCSMNLHCVDLLGVHYKDKDKEKKVTTVNLTDPIIIKIFNVFFRKDAPFNYNMHSNNAWLEVFSWDNFTNDVPKNFHKVVNPNVKSNYFLDFVVPQFELDSTYKNYKSTFIEVYPNEPVTIKVDEMFEINQNHYRTAENYHEPLKIRIEKYERNGKHVSVPIATFMPIC
jgi:hypothetical protein